MSGFSFYIFLYCLCCYAADYLGSECNIFCEGAYLFIADCAKHIFQGGVT